MKRIVIIGSNGAGKSTFARRLSEKLNIPATHLDRLYWCGDWQVVPHDVFLERVEQTMQAPSWIIDGNNLRSLDKRLEKADTLFWLELPPALCVWNVIKREMRCKGKARPDMPESCKSRIDPDFLRIVWRFNAKNRKKIHEMLQQFPMVKVYHFRNYRQIRKFLEGEIHVSL